MIFWNTILADEELLLRDTSDCGENLCSYHLGEDDSCLTYTTSGSVDQDALTLGKTTEIKQRIVSRAIDDWDSRSILQGHRVGDLLRTCPKTSGVRGICTLRHGAHTITNSQVSHFATDCANDTSTFNSNVFA